MGEKELSQNRHETHDARSVRSEHKLRAPELRPANNDGRDQPIGAFHAGVVTSGYHMDLRGVAGSYGEPYQADAWLELLVERRERTMPVTVLQLGLGAWQRAVTAPDKDAAAWMEIAEKVAHWAANDVNEDGLFIHYQPMPHTYEIPGGWFSAMAQGLGVSLLVRAGKYADATRVLEALLDPKHGLVTASKHGPILEEYPANPRPHVLNGWIWALFGLYDYAYIDPDNAADLDEKTGFDRAVAARASDEFTRGVASLVAQLSEYETGRGWSTYDRYPHPIANVASPFYHRLHVDMLNALARIAPHAELTETSARWEQALHRPVTKFSAVARKVGFRMVRPRGKAA